MIKYKLGMITFMLFLTLALSCAVVSAADFQQVQDEIDSGSININLGNGLYTPGTADTINVNKNNVIIRGQSASSKAILDGQGGNSRIMRVSGDNVRLENLIFRNADVDSSYGAGVYAAGSNLTIINCEFINNKGINGGLILHEDSTNALIQNCIFVNNRAAYPDTNGGGGGSGGAIDSHSSNGRIINCTFNSNSGINGGGALYFIFGTNNTINGCTFTGNSAPRGGAIWTGTSGTTLTVSSSIFNSNKATGNGGAIYSVNTLSVSNSNFTISSANNGGALYSTGTLNINNANFNNNKATNNGGALYSNSVSRISASKFISNAANYGSAIYSNKTLNLTSTSFSNNKANTNLAISLPNGVSYNLVSLVADKAKYSPTVVKVVLTKNDNVADAIWQTSSGSAYIDNKKQTTNNLLSNQKVTLNSKYSATTNSSGIALIKFNENTLTGFKGLAKTSDVYKYTFSAKFDGNNLYSTSSNSLSASAKVSNSKVDSYWNLMTKKLNSVKTTTTYAINKTGWYKKPTTAWTKISKPSSSGTWQKYNTKTKKWGSSKAYTQATSATKVYYKNVKNNVIYLINKTGWFKKSNWTKVSKPSSSGTWQKYDSKTKKWSSSGAYTTATSTTKVYYKNTITTTSSVNNGLAPYVKSDLEVTTSVNGKSSKYAQKGVYIASTTDIYFKDDLTDKERSKYKEALTNHDANKNWVHVNDPAVKKQLITLLKDYEFSRVNGELTSLSKAKAIYNWVVEKEKYGYYRNSKHSDLWSIPRIKAIKEKGDKSIDLINCADHSNLVVSLLRTAGIPAVYAHSSWEGGHYWACAYVKSINKDGKIVTSWHWLDTIHNYFKYNISPNVKGTAHFRANPKVAIDGIKYAKNVTKKDLAKY